MDIGDRVLVNSALAFATVVEVQQDRYVVEFPDGYRCVRHESELTQ